VPLVACEDRSRSGDAAVDVEFLADEALLGALLVALDRVMSRWALVSGKSLSCAESSDRVGSVWTWSSTLTDGASPPPFLTSTMVKYTEQDRFLPRNTRQRGGESASEGGRRPLSGQVVRERPDIKPA